MREQILHLKGFYKIRHIWHMVGVGREAFWIEYGNTAGAAAAATTVNLKPRPLILVAIMQNCRSAGYYNVYIGDVWSSFGIHLWSKCNQMIHLQAGIH